MSVSLPALRGDDPLGFLAAVGLMALSEQGEIPSIRFAWEGGTAPIAAVEGVSGVEELGHALTDTFQRLEASGGVIPGVRNDFPERKDGASGSDPMRMPPTKLAGWYEVAQHDPLLGRWLVAIAGQATTKDKGDVELTPFYAPTGQMSLRTSIFEKTMAAVRDVEGPADALTAWRRTHYDGANFDGRAKRDAGVTTTGKSDNQGAPSPTWLAAMGMRLFAMTDDGRRVRTVGWQRIRMYEGFTFRSLVWPVWAPMLDAAAVRTLLAHPALELAVAEDGTPRVLPRNEPTLRALGVTVVFGSSRRTTRRGDGPLGPARAVWVATSESPVASGQLSASAGRSWSGRPRTVTERK